MLFRSHGDNPLDRSELAPPLVEGPAVGDIEVVEHVLHQPGLDLVADLSDVHSLGLAACELVLKVVECPVGQPCGQQAIEGAR